MNQISVDSNSEDLIKMFKEEAQKLFKNQIISRWQSSANVWRNAWAMDTILDYFSVCDISPSDFGKNALNALNPNKAGAWWDDFGWIGIASLRAAEQNISPKHTEDFVKTAINAWAYMYGPGWSKTNTAIYPFTDIPGWKKYANKHTPNVGAPNVWQDITTTWAGITEKQKMERQPRYSPGGAWNSTYQNQWSPSLSQSYQGDINGELNPLQNTVTNGLYAILTLRIYLASQNAAFSKVFSESTFDADACLQAWKDQIQWINQWVMETNDAEQSLSLKLDQDVLIRERVSTFHEYKGQKYWDSAYRKDLTWAGDQGLLLGALREAKASGLLQKSPKVVDIYPDIIQGVFNNCFANRTYDGANSYFLMPWTVIGAQNPYTVISPGEDDGDYQTGNGVFMRYLLQAYKAEPDLVNQYKNIILTSAIIFCRIEADTVGKPSSQCDGYTQNLSNSVDEMTAFVNRLSVLLLAIEMCS